MTSKRIITPLSLMVLFLVASAPQLLAERSGRLTRRIIEKPADRLVDETLELYRDARRLSRQRAPELRASLASLEELSDAAQRFERDVERPWRSAERLDADYHALVEAYWQSARELEFVHQAAETDDRMETLKAQLGDVSLTLNRIAFRYTGDWLEHYVVQPPNTSCRRQTQIGPVILCLADPAVLQSETRPSTATIERRRVADDR